MTIIQPKVIHKLRDVRKLVAAFKKPRQTKSGETMLISAHRGLRWNGAVENTLDAVIRAADAGLPSVEVDIRTTADGVVVCLHDDGLGRISDVEQVLGSDDRYDESTGTGFNPLVADLKWAELEQLHLRDQHGNLTSALLSGGRIVRVIESELSRGLAGVRAAHIDILVFLDFKDAASIPASFDIVRQYTNAAGASAIEWCVWKTALEFIPHPDALETASWYSVCCQEFGHGPLWIPVFDPDFCSDEEAMQVAEAWSERPYVVAFEVGLRSPNGPLLPVVKFAQEQGISLGFFGALGEIENDLKSPSERLVHWENHGMVTYDQVLKPGQSDDGHDHRGDIELFKSLGYSWVIADRTRELEPFFEDAAKGMSMFDR